VKSAYAVFNVDQEAEVQKGIADLAGQLGSVDILINNAGIGNMGTLEDMSSMFGNK
jgi:3-oxoacyl-[acyl-carrier protein] reductase